MTHTATYSPEDNKLRLYPAHRLDAETYARVKAAGFIWAPKQELFVAPMWTPGREDLLIDLCGEVGDEDTSLVDRAEVRADRFEDYSESRAEDAERARNAVAAIADNIPLGQPILIGHHSERHARKDAERIQNGMRKAVKMWETSKYWTARAAGAIHHAKYKELPQVRARRIKGIETDKRRNEKATAESAMWSKVWTNLEGIKRTNGEPMTLREQAMAIANRDHVSKCFTLAEFPRNPPASQYEGMMSLWSALDGNICTAEQAREIALRVHARGVEGRARWHTHYENRLAYEKAMLEEQGELKLLDKKPRPELKPLLNYRATGGKITTENQWNRGESITYPQIDMTKAQYAAIHADYKGARLSADRQHRFRTAMQRQALVAVYLTDSKDHGEPKQGPMVSTRRELRQPTAPIMPREREPEDARAADFDAMRQSLKAGVQVVSAPQLFPTPRDLAQRVVDLAGIRPGHIVLEPSAGTGALLGAMGGRMFGHNPERGAVVAVEVNHSLATRLEKEFPLTRVRCADFLECNGDLGTFDRIVMNPPFANGADIKHILHARGMLNDGGVLVAICANGPRQRAALMDIAEHWEDLPAGTFADQGTGVNTALVVLRA